MIDIINKAPKLRRVPQLGATLDSGRAKKPSLDEARADDELNPGDRVEGLGDFGKPTGEFCTVEQANKDDAVVKCDNGGHYPQRPRFTASRIKVRT